MTRVSFNQDTPWPTRKLGTGAVVAGAVVEVWGRVMPDLLPALSGPGVTILVGTCTSMAVAYWVRDTRKKEPG